MDAASGTAGPPGQPGEASAVGIPDYVHLAWHGDDGRRPGPRRSLQMRAIAAAGVELADEGGLGRVSMRAVGARLGMTSMGLYRYVQAKNELLALMVDEAAERYQEGLPCGAEANMAKLLAADASWAAADTCVQTLGGFAFAEEFDVERKFRETRLYQVAPISTNLILSYLSEHVLGLPRSY